MKSAEVFAYFSVYNLPMSYRHKPERAITISQTRPKSVLNASGPNEFTLNPYAGCPVGCAYCYLPHLAYKQAETRRWGSYVDVKEGAAELLERQLSRLRRPATVFMSTATDPYQPLEERYQTTRAMLEVFARHPEHGLFILTKQALVERDADILAELPRVAVGMSISVIEDAIASVIEPWAPATSERLAIIRRLSERGIATYILWAPAIVPLKMSLEYIKEAIEKIVRSRARALSLDVLNYRSRQPKGLLRRLLREGFIPASHAQLKSIQAEAERRGLARRIELLPPAKLEPATPLLPFEEDESAQFTATIS